MTLLATWERKIRILREARRVKFGLTLWNDIYGDGIDASIDQIFHWGYRGGSGNRGAVDRRRTPMLNTPRLIKGVDQMQFLVDVRSTARV